MLFIELIVDRLIAMDNASFREEKRPLTTEESVNVATPTIKLLSTIIESEYQPNFIWD